jgi:hypothetical protein
MNNIYDLYMNNIYDLYTTYIFASTVFTIKKTSLENLENIYPFNFQQKEKTIDLL